MSQSTPATALSSADPSANLETVVVVPAPATHAGPSVTPPNEFIPVEPSTWQETKLSHTEVGGLILKILLNLGNCTGRRIADQLKLPFRLVQELLHDLKHQLLVSYKGSSLVNDYEYELTNSGLERARRYQLQSTYCGAAPVALDDYFSSVTRQSFRRCRPRMAALRQAYSDMLVSDEVLGQLGQAANAARGLFLYGAAGNGKSSIAERLVRTAGDLIWIPRTLAISGDVIRLYDPACHREVPIESNDQLMQTSRIDKRWVQIKRPTVVVGGELRLDHLDVTFNAVRGINEAPLQLKSNCGALVIDDFGRQRVSTSELLNRFIIPLEKAVDYVSLPSGRQLQVPFDQMLVFATNLEPKQLFDEAFLRRIPYKIEVRDPSEKEFLALFLHLAQNEKLTVEKVALDCLLDFYRQSERPFRYCHPRDLLDQIKTYCDFQNEPPEVTTGTLGIALKNYFGGI